MSKTKLIDLPLSGIRQVLQTIGAEKLGEDGWLGSKAAGPKSFDSYEGWKRDALEKDDASGMTAWKDIDETSLYDFAAIRARRDALRKMLKDHDDHGLLFALNEGLHGNMDGIGKTALYQQAAIGTKVLITEYIDAICEGLHHLAHCTNSGISEDEKTDFFRRAHVCYGSSALLLSGGGIYGNFHVGLVKTLIEQDLLPSVISGSSAGSLIAAVVGTHTRDELGELLNERHLQVESEYAEQVIKGMFAGVFDVQQISRHIERLIPNLTFAEALKRTGIHINITVSPKDMHQQPRLLNAVTSPNVYVRSAVLASCSVPGVFPPAMLVAKNRNGNPQPYLPTRRWYDGSMSDDIPAKRLARLYGVNHFIVSQVNPFALPMSREYSSRLAPYGALIQLYRRSSLGVATTVQDLFNRYGSRWPGINFALNGVVSLLAQEYKGDINIMPDMGMVKPWRGMTTPTRGELREIIHAGERATWPKVEMIRNCTKIARMLGGILKQREGQPAVGRHIITRPVAKKTRAKKSAAA